MNGRYPPDGRVKVTIGTIPFESAPLVWGVPRNRWVSPSGWDLLVSEAPNVPLPIIEVLCESGPRHAEPVPVFAALRLASLDVDAYVAAHGGNGRSYLEALLKRHPGSWMVTPHTFRFSNKDGARHSEYGIREHPAAPAPAFQLRCRRCQEHGTGYIRGADPALVQATLELFWNKAGKPHRLRDNNGMVHSAILPLTLKAFAVVLNSPLAKNRATHGAS